LKRESKIISVRITEDEFKRLQSEAVERLLTISELVRVIIDQRQRMGGRQFEERLIRIEEMLGDFKNISIDKGLKKILYHSTRASLSLIAQYRMVHGDKEADEIGRAIKEEHKKYLDYLRQTGKEI